MIRLTNVLLVTLMICLTGCEEHDRGSKRTVQTVPASGTLTLDDQPFGPIHIDLLPLTSGENVRIARANVNEDGTFVLGTYEEEDGAAPGSYRVVLGNMGENLMDPPPAVQDTQVMIPEGGGDSIKIILKSAKGDAAADSLLNPNIKKAK